MATVARTDIDRSPVPQPLLWIVPLTLAWTLLITWRPAITASAVPMTAARLTVHGMIALGLWLALERTDLSSEQRRRTWLWIIAPLTLWLAVAWNASIKGVFAVAPNVPLLPIAIIGPVIVGA